MHFLSELLVHFFIFVCSFIHRNIIFVQINTSGRQDVNIEERESDACTRDSRGRMEEQEAIFFEVNRVCT